MKKLILPILLLAAVCAGTMVRAAGTVPTRRVTRTALVNAVRRARPHLLVDSVAADTSAVLSIVGTTELPDAYTPAYGEQFACTDTVTLVRMDITPCAADTVITVPTVLEFTPQGYTVRTAADTAAVAHDYVDSSFAELRGYITRARLRRVGEHPAVFGESDTPDSLTGYRLQVYSHGDCLLDVSRADGVQNYEGALHRVGRFMEIFL